MRTSRQRFGGEGEEQAAALLRSKGYAVIGRNIRVGRIGEIDILARHRGVLVFVEVKARRDAAFGDPEEALTPFKRRSFSAAIRGYLASRGLDGARFRADVVAIDLSAGAIRHLEAVSLGEP